MEALCNLDSSLYVDTEEVIKYTETKLHEWGEKIRQIKRPICYLYWCKEKKGSDENHVARTYLSTKMIKTVTSTVFADDLIKDIRELSDHTKRMISQFYKIKQIKEIIAENNNSLCIRVDCSENDNLFQARQEKGSYCHNSQVSFNAIVAYQSSGVSLHDTISGAKSHKAPAVWASLEKVLESFNLEQLKYLYVILDSPTSHYHNKYNAFFTKRFDVENNIHIYWVFTESGHGKGPMDAALELHLRTILMMLWLSIQIV